ncbi:MAG: hypothetical protein ACXQTM_08340 [Methanosarcinales archaeon]
MKFIAKNRRVEEWKPCEGAVLTVARRLTSDSPYWKFEWASEDVWIVDVPDIWTLLSLVDQHGVVTVRKSNYEGYLYELEVG